MTTNKKLDQMRIVQQQQEDDEDMERRCGCCLAEMADNDGSGSATASVGSASPTTNLNIPKVQPEENGKKSDSLAALCSTATKVKHPKRVLLMVLLLLLIASAAAAAILTIGLISSRRSNERAFDKIANGLLVELDVSLRDYISAGQWVHQSCRRVRERRYMYLSEAASCSEKDSCKVPSPAEAHFQAQQDFAELYENLMATGLISNGVSYAMNISNDEREGLENETRAYLAQFYPDIEYRGIQEFTDNGGLVPRDANSSSFYMAAHFVEPMEQTASVLDVDVYTSAPRKLAIDQALKTWKPVLSERLRVAHQLSGDIYSVVLVHSGIPIKSNPDVRPRDVTMMGILMPDVMLHARRKVAVVMEGHTASVYIFDSTTSKDNPAFLGGAKLSGKSFNTTEEFQFTSETNLSQLLTECSSSSCYSRVKRYPVASREWTFVVMASQKDFALADMTFVIVGAVMIFLACSCMAFWVYTDRRHITKMNQLRSSAQAEKHALVVESAQQATRLEQQLNEFMAHEVRNPVSAAVAACHFITCAIAPKGGDSRSQDGTHDYNGKATKKEGGLVLDAESRVAIEEDVQIIDTSLQFINDILRNILDMNRALSNQLIIVNKPVEIQTDILLPVASMLYRRGHNYTVEIDCCPRNLVINTDRLRLKQTILNLATNAAKFVRKGYIRIGAKLQEQHPSSDNDGDGSKNNYSVQLFVEDSGPGIPLEKRVDLFQKFQDSLDFMHQGTGVGLSLCKNLVELMGGDIYLDETFDSGIQGFPGTRFVVDLKTEPVSILPGNDDDDIDDDVDNEKDGNNPQEKDVVKAETTGAAATAAADVTDSLLSSVDVNNSHCTDTTAATADTATLLLVVDNPGVVPPRPPEELPCELSVLFVDDDMVLRKIFMRALRKVAPTWHIMEAASGETALRLIDDQQQQHQRNVFDIIFLDQYMSSAERQLLGTETARALRARVLDTTILCGLSANDLKTSFLEAGADTFLMKPFPCAKDALTRELLRVLGCSGNHRHRRTLADGNQ